MPNRTLVIAHRGLHATGLPENTLAAFEAAHLAGAEMIEFDVRRSGAGELAILHDHAIGAVPLDSCSLDEFQQRTGFRPPLLSEALGWADGRIALDVELKEDGYAHEVAPALEAFAAAGNELIVTSFVDPLLATLAQRAPSLKLGLLLSWTAADSLSRARAVGARIVLPEAKLISEAVIEEITGDGLDLIIWDYMAHQNPEWLSDPRVSAVITDDVPTALQARS